MLATIEEQSNHHVATFKRQLPHSIDVVWAAITENDKLQKWMSNLEIIDLRKNGKMHFNMNDGTDAYEKKPLPIMQKMKLSNLIGVRIRYDSNFLLMTRAHSSY